MTVSESERYSDLRRLLFGVAGGGSLAGLSLWAARVAAPIADSYWSPSPSTLYAVQIGRLLVYFGSLCLLESLVLMLVGRVRSGIHIAAKMLMVSGTTALALACYLLILSSDAIRLEGLIRFRFSSLIFELLLTTVVASTSWLLFIRPATPRLWSALAFCTILVALIGGIASNRAVFRGALEGSGVLRPATIKHASGAHQPPTRFLVYALASPLGGILFLLRHRSTRDKEAVPPPETGTVPPEKPS